MLKFVFLGTNGSCQDIGCGNTSLLIFGSNGVFCVDLSCNIPQIVDVDIDAVVLTHEHIDHVYALPSLLHQLWLCGRTRELKIIVPKGMEFVPEGLIDLFQLKSKKNIFDIQVISCDSFELGTMHINLFKTDHTATSVGIIVTDGKDKLVYTCDTRPIKAAVAMMDGAKVLIHESSGEKKDEEVLIRKGHSSGSDAADLANKIKVDRMYLCHLPKGDDAKQRILKEARSSFSKTYIPEILVEYTV